MKIKFRIGDDIRLKMEKKIYSTEEIEALKRNSGGKPAPAAIVPNGVPPELSVVGKATKIEED